MTAGSVIFVELNRVERISEQVVIQGLSRHDNALHLEAELVSLSFFEAPPVLIVDLVIDLLGTLLDAILKVSLLLKRIFLVRLFTRLLWEGVLRALRLRWLSMGYGLL